MHEHYYSLNRYLRETFGEKVYKLALDGGMTCPNRDGTLGYGGCVFCGSGGSGDFAEGRCVDGINEQIRRAKTRVAKKTDADRFIAYFQSYSNTYAPVSYLRQIFTEAIDHPEVAVLSVATRPDCLPAEVVELLGELNQIKPVWVELGLQTIHEDTARLIHRGYELPCFEEAVAALRSVGVEVIVHVILGLPGEDKTRMLQTVDYLARQDIQGVKLQLLHILEGTELARMYRRGEVQPMTLEAYMDVLFAAIERLPPSMVLHRITGDGPKRILIEPQWSRDKKRVLNTIRQEMERRDVRQGSKFETL